MSPSPSCQTWQTSSVPRQWRGTCARGVGIAQGRHFHGRKTVLLQIGDGVDALLEGLDVSVADVFALVIVEAHLGVVGFDNFAGFVDGAAAAIDAGGRCRTVLAVVFGGVIEDAADSDAFELRDGGSDARLVFAGAKVTKEGRLEQSVRDAVARHAARHFEQTLGMAHQRSDLAETKGHDGLGQLTVGFGLVRGLRVVEIGCGKTTTTSSRCTAVLGLLRCSMIFLGTAGVLVVVAPVAPRDVSPATLLLYLQQKSRRRPPSTNPESMEAGPVPAESGILTTESRLMGTPAARTREGPSAPLRP